MKQKKTLDYQEIISQMPGHVYWVDKNNVFQGCNEKQAKTFGLQSPQDITGKPVAEFQPTEEIANQILSINSKVIETGNPVIAEEPYINSSGKTEIYLSQKKPLRNKDSEIVGMIGISFDITTIKELEKLLADSQKRTETLLSDIISEMPGHVYWKDLNGVYLGCNQAQALSLGYFSSSEIIGKTDFELSPKKIAETLREQDQEVIKQDKVETLEEIAVLKDGQEHIFLTKKQPLKNNHGKIIGILGISFDITEQKKIEKELIDTKARLDGMTLLGASIAHELRTPFANLNITTQTIEKKISTLDNDAQHIETDLNSVKKEIKAALTFIDMLLLNINPTINEAKITNFSMKECINHTIERYPFVGKQHELIKWDAKKNTDFIVRGEELLVIHLFFNLIKNSLYYIAKARKGNIEIWIENRTVFVKDTGTGIKAEHLPHIFKHFFSQTYHGAGVGLTFCKWVMDNLNGKITCESEEGHYTLFTLEFPNNT